MKSPLPAFAAMVLCGAWLGTFLPFDIVIYIIFILVLGFAVKVILLGNAAKMSVVFSAVLIVLFAGSAFRAGWVKSCNFEVCRRFSGKDITVSGEVLSLRRAENITFVEIKTHSFGFEGKDFNVKTKVSLNITGEPLELNIRDVVKGSGLLRLYEPMLFWGGWSNRGYWASKGIFASIAADSADVEITPGSRKKVDLLLFGNIAREHIRKIIDKYIPGDEGALTKGILIGDKQDFSTDLKDAFRLSGMSHIVAVSGLHISIFIIFVSFGSVGIISSRKKRAFLIIFTVAGYVVVTGPQPSIMRAAIMAVYGLLLENCKLRRDSFSALMVSLILLMFANPYMLYDTGFQLSFMATMGIVLLQGRICRYDIANAGIAAFIFTAPIVAYSFNTVTFSALLANILISPLVIIALLLGAIMCAVPFSGFLISPVLFCISHVMILISKIFASIKFLAPNVSSPSIMTIICCYFGIYVFYLILAYPEQKRKTAAAAAILSVLVAGSLIYSNQSHMSVTFVATKSGDAVYIKTPNGSSILVDAGYGYDIYSFLGKKNIKKLDAVIITNRKNEDTNGLYYISDKIEIGEILLPLHGNFNLWDLEKKSKIMYYDMGSTYKADDVLFEIKMYDYNAKSLNEKSAAVKVTYEGTSAMLLGDFGKEREYEMINTCNKDDLKCNIVRLANHGARTSNSNELIDILSPQYAVANAGFNSGIRPSEEVIEYLNEKDIRILKTYESGSITFVINKNGIARIKKTIIF